MCLGGYADKVINIRYKEVLVLFMQIYFILVILMNIFNIIMVNIMIFYSVKTIC